MCLHTSDDPMGYGGRVRNRKEQVKSQLSVWTRYDIEGEFVRVRTLPACEAVKAAWIGPHRDKARRGVRWRSHASWKLGRTCRCLRAGEESWEPLLDAAYRACRENWRQRGCRTGFDMEWQ